MSAPGDAPYDLHVMPSAPTPSPASSRQVRLAEVICALSLATDVGSGQPLGQGLRSAILAVRLAEAAGLDEDAAADAYYLALLRYVGCTTDAHLVAEIFGDELAAGAWFSELDFGNPANMLPGIIRNQGRDMPPSVRARLVLSALAGMPRMMQMPTAHCEIAARLAVRLSLGPGIRAGIVQLMVRWDGRMMPRGAARGEAILLPSRVAMLARDASVMHRAGGVDAAGTMARQRSGGAHDPALVETLLAAGPQLFDGLSTVGWDEALAAEPGPRPLLSPSELEAALEAVADFVDLKFPTLAGHSRGVAGLAGEAGRRAGLEERDATELLHAGLVHDLGRVAVSAAIWQRAGPLSDDDWEKVRLHPYHTERFLARAEHLARLGAVASLHHERLDGGGYHRGASAGHLAFAARLLAAADVYQAMIEPRPHRPALSAEAAADQLRTEARRGRLDPQSVTAVCAAAGHRITMRRRAWPMDLTDREVEVLRLLARGLTNPEMARLLHLSPKTVGHHVEHLYDKIGVSTRPAAALFAMEHDLLRD